MGTYGSRTQSFLNNRWLVFVAAMWVQSCGGVGYLYGSLSPILKSKLNYDQRQVASLGVAKDLGDSVGFLAGVLSEVLPLWGLLFVGAVQNFVGYGLVWLVVTGKIVQLPLLAMWVLIFVGTNGETYFNTAALVSCVQNFPKNRGPVVGILKGFAGLSGAILTQVYALIHTPESAALIFMVAVGPTMVVITLMFFVRPVKGHRQVRPADGSYFTFVYSICLLLAAYLMGVMIVEDIVDLSHKVVVIFTAGLFFILLVPIMIPLVSSCCFDTITPEQESFLSDAPNEEEGQSFLSASNETEVILSEVEDEKPRDIDLLPANERQMRIAQLQAKLFQAAAEGAVRVKRKKGPKRGENFTLTQALVKADFWLIFFSLMLGSGSGLTIIDNLGQISESLGYSEPHIFVSLISIWNFLGRVGGGFFSEIIARDKHVPRPLALAVAQILMAIGHFLLAMAWPGTLYVSTLLIGLGYGAHWAIVPATASELFGLKNFGALYNCLTVANPAGSLIFSGLIASNIYDSEARKQAYQPNYSFSILGFLLGGGLNEEKTLKCMGQVCFFVTSLVLCGLCIIASVFSSILVYRTRRIYTSMYSNVHT